MYFMMLKLAEHHKDKIAISIQQNKWKKNYLNTQFCKIYLRSTLVSVEIDAEHIEQLLAVMTPEIYQRLVTAVELGKWPDGVVLTPDQKEHSLQMVLLWQSRNNHNPDHMTVGTDGQITMKSKQELKSIFQGDMLATLKPQNHD